MLPILIGAFVVIAALAKYGKSGNRDAPPKTKEDINDGKGDAQEAEDTIDDVGEELLTTPGLTTTPTVGTGVLGAATGAAGAIVGALAAQLGASPTQAAILTTGAIVAIVAVYSIGWMAGAIAVALTVVVFAIDTVVEQVKADADRRAGGPLKRWLTARDSVQAIVHRKIQMQYTLESGDPAGWRIAVPFSDGYAKMANIHAVETHRRAPWGMAFIGQEAHMEIGWQLGKWLKNAEVDPHLRSPILDTPERLAAVPPNQRTATMDGQPVDAYWDRCFRMGRFTANIVAYVNHMQTAHGLGVNDDGHAQYGIDKGFFLGSIVKGSMEFKSMDGGEPVDVRAEGGVLEYEGKLIYYKGANGAIGIFIKMSEEDISNTQLAMQGKNPGAFVGTGTIVKLPSTVQPVGTLAEDIAIAINPIAPKPTIAPVTVSSVPKTTTTIATTVTPTTTTTQTAWKYWDPELKKWVIGVP